MASSGYRTTSSSTPLPALGRGPPPPPIRIAPGHVGTPSGTDRAQHQHGSATSNQSPTTLLYELPPSTSPRPPPLLSAKNRSRSPPYPSSRVDTARRTSLGTVLHPRQDNNNASFDTPSPVSKLQNSKLRQTSLNDYLEPRQEDLDAFVDLCRKWYYDQDDLSGRLMSQTLANTAPAHRATYTRLQASPGNSLTLAARASPSGPLAKRERHERVEKFIQSHCVSGVPGTHPFFEGLYGILRLQTLPETLGGAGGKIIQWEIDDAIFIETAGKEFTHDAVDILKGVLGFSESLNESSPSLASFDLSRGPPIPEDESATLVGSSELSTSPGTHTAIASRGRAPSNPFLDPSRSNQSSLNAQLDEPTSPTGLDTPLVPPPMPPQASSMRASPSGMTVQSFNSISMLNDPQLRTWTFPPLENPELHSFMKLFPRFIVQRSTGRFPTTSMSGRQKGSERTMEEGLERGRVGVDIKVGTGQMWVSAMPREDGWQGGFWDRFLQWFKNLFG
ncbi:uncharacterized protein EI90DRAFT_3123823 [Cantharellus anzutake]|uniref:uncharacterized protein n=1 Tax=Cantharellus anzutake TaxID=1750568 RepID=UPI0019083CFC|nr:uncharacterized protein EI90DRAFT_3123823 [Cantharellus anzutake]KAF8331083.1 hypothetical protein EI90DRAFT_3123823 [Cantharellus anzutake]